MYFEFLAKKAASNGVTKNLEKYETPSKFVISVCVCVCIKVNNDLRPMRGKKQVKPCFTKLPAAVNQ